MTGAEIKRLIKTYSTCVTCGRPPTKGKSLCIDHNHSTGKVRGLLCNSCNSGIGFFKENIAVLQNVIRYLIENQ